MRDHGWSGGGEAFYDSLRVRLSVRARYRAGAFRYADSGFFVPRPVTTTSLGGRRLGESPSTSRSPRAAARTTFAVSIQGVDAAALGQRAHPRWCSPTSRSQRPRTPPRSCAQSRSAVQWARCFFGEQRRASRSPRRSGSVAGAPPTPRRAAARPCGRHGGSGPRRPGARVGEDGGRSAPGAGSARERSARGREGGRGRARTSTSRGRTARALVLYRRRPMSRGRRSARRRGHLAARARRGRSDPAPRGSCCFGSRVGSTSDRNRRARWRDGSPSWGCTSPRACTLCRRVSSSSSMRSRWRPTRAAPATLRLRSSPEGARMVIDGVHRCAAPCGLEALIGEHVIATSRDGYSSSVRAVSPRVGVGATSRSRFVPHLRDWPRVNGARASATVMMSTPGPSLALLSRAIRRAS